MLLSLYISLTIKLSLSPINNHFCIHGKSSFWTFSLSLYRNSVILYLFSTKRNTFSFRIRMTVNKMRQTHVSSRKYTFYSSTLNSYCVVKLIRRRKKLAKLYGNGWHRVICIYPQEVKHLQFSQWSTQKNDIKQMWKSQPKGLLENMFERDFWREKLKK